jgi:hypothetical protein
MRRSRSVDRLVLATLLPLVLGFLALGAIDRLHHPSAFPSFYTSGATGPESYPVVGGDLDPSAPVARGDRLIRVGDKDLRGASRVEVLRLLRPHLRGEGSVPIELERAGARLQVRAHPVADRYWWLPLIPTLALIAVASFLLLRAPYWHLARRFFLATVCWALTLSGAQFIPLRASVALFEGFQFLAIALTVWTAFELTEAARPLRPWRARRPGPWRRCNSPSSSLGTGSPSRAAWSSSRPSTLASASVWRSCSLG